MGLGNITYGGNNVRFGKDADKPVSPNPADEYIAIDTGKKYVCYTENVWSNVSPKTTKTNYESGTDLTLIDFNGEYTETKSYGYNAEKDIVEFSINDKEMGGDINSYTLRLSANGTGDNEVFKLRLYKDDVVINSTTWSTYNNATKNLTIDEPLEENVNYKITVDREEDSGAGVVNLTITSIQIRCNYTIEPNFNIDTSITGY